MQSIAFPIIGFAWDVAESGILILLAIYITSLTIFDDHFHYKIE
ncbi:hypothetical protein BSUBE1_2538 [Bacillus subtilis E1]|nr:hypothetical protein BSSX_2686 [Bacillus subtilis]RPK11512.1 hypothetical protein EH5_01677 [Bacillus subtilis]CCU59169.1 hypothetical protein BSUBE1_2538 [Bacillus subtilis E1]